MPQKKYQFQKFANPDVAETFHFEGNRSIIFSESSKLPEKELKQCISFALTYHSDKKKKPN